MANKCYIEGLNTHDGLKLSAHVRSFKSQAKHHNGVVVLTRELAEHQPVTIPFLNSDYGNHINQTVTFGGTPDEVYDGNDTSLWTASILSGSRVTLEQDDARAHSAVFTVGDYTALSGDTATIGVDGADTVVTEGVEWTAATSNDATATSLASALDAVSGVSASATSAVVAVIADAGINISKGDVSDNLNLPASAKALYANSMALGESFQFYKGSNFTHANYSALTGWINVDQHWDAGDTMEIFGYDTGTPGEVGVRLDLTDYITEGNTDTWQSFVIPMADFLFTEATIDAIRVEQIAKDGPKTPVFYMDDLQFEETGSPISFTVAPHVGETLRIGSLSMTLADNVTGNAGKSYDKILGLSSLQNGLTYTRVQNGVTEFGANVHQMSDLFGFGGVEKNRIDDGTNTCITLEVDLHEPILLEGPSSQNYLRLTVNDDMSGLLHFNAVARGTSEV